MTAARKPVKALNKDAATVAANAAADKARKAASRKALRDAKTDKDADAAAFEAAIRADAATYDHEHREPEPVLTQTPDVPRETAKPDTTAVYEAAIRADAASLGLDAAAIELYVADHLDTTEKKCKYVGPMLALVAARKAYVKGANGNPHNGDLIGQAFSAMARPDVIRVCVILLGLPGNPYLTLNPGQQSMNLRNRLRHAIRNGFVTPGALIGMTPEVLSGLAAQPTA